MGPRENPFDFDKHGFSRAATMNKRWDRVDIVLWVPANTLFAFM
jgi:hypothetical protein